MNKVLLNGRLTNDSKVNTTPNGRKYIRNALAVSRDFKNKNGGYDVDFIDFVLFDSSAEYLEKYCHKGDTIILEGHLQVNQYKDSKKLEIMGEKVNYICSAIGGKESKEFEVSSEELPF